MKISGYWFPAGASRRWNATLYLHGEEYALDIVPADSDSEDDDAPDMPPPPHGRIADLNISARIGNIPRVITFADRSVLETEANDEFDHWLQHSATAAGSGLAHALESKWRWAAAGVLVLALFVFAGVRWFLPWSSDRIAEWMPPVAVYAISDGTLALMDEVFFDPSELPAHQREQIERRFSTLASSAAGINSEFDYALHFRKLGLANALALPSGQIVLTDELVKLADNQAEIDSVMLHEIGHVEHRHGLKAAVRASFLSIAIALFFGDPGGVNELIVSLPVVLLETHYSRAHESEADEFAFDKMLELGIDPAHFAAIMTRLEAHARDADDEEEKSDDETGSAPDYLNTHPPTPERIERANAYSKEFRAAK